MARDFSTMRTADIKGWSNEDAKRYLNYLRQNDIGLYLYTDRHVVTIAPRVNGFTVDLNNGCGPMICSDFETRSKILDAVALDHHGRAKKELREWNRAVTGRMSGRDNCIDKIENKIADVIDWVFA